MASIAPGSSDREPKKAAPSPPPAHQPSPAVAYPGSPPPPTGASGYPPPPPGYLPPGYPPPPPGYLPPGYPPPGYPPPAYLAPRSGSQGFPGGAPGLTEGEETDPPPRTERDAGAWLLFAGLGFIIGQLASSILLVAVAAATGHTSDVAQLAAEPVPPAWIVVTGLVGLWAGFIGAAVFASRSRGTGNLRRDMGLEVRPWDLLIGPVVGFAGQIVLLPLLYFPLEHVVRHLNQRLDAPAQHLTGGFPGSDLAVIAVLTVVVVPVIEETFFRGLILRALLRVFKRAGPVLGVTFAVVADGVIFGLAHFELLQLLGLAAFGVVLALMAYKLGRIGAGIFAHGMFNLLAILSVAGVLH